MGKFNIYDMDELKNVNEKRVWALLSDYLDTCGPEICQCGVCVVDMAAITLNNIKPCYQVEIHMDVAQKNVPDEEIIAQIKKAVELVGRRPHH